MLIPALIIKIHAKKSYKSTIIISVKYQVITSSKNTIAYDSKQLKKIPWRGNY